jgi:apolipoprotein N-acyltransferase
MAVSIFQVEEHIQVTRGVAVFGFGLLLSSCFATSRKFSGVIPVMDFTRIGPPLGFGSAFTASCFVSLSVGSDSADTFAGAVSLASSGLAAVMAFATTTLPCCRPRARSCHNEWKESGVQHRNKPKSNDV